LEVEGVQQAVLDVDHQAHQRQRLDSAAGADQCLVRGRAETACGGELRVDGIDGLLQDGKDGVSGTHVASSSGERGASAGATAAACSSRVERIPTKAWLSAKPVARPARALAN